MIGQLSDLLNQVEGAVNRTVTIERAALQVAVLRQALGAEQHTTDHLQGARGEVSNA